MELDLELYRRDVVVSDEPRVRLSAIDIEPGEEATEEEIRRLCEERLDEYKIPERIEFRAELPKSMVGKVLRRMLAEEEERREIEKDSL